MNKLPEKDIPLINFHAEVSKETIQELMNLFTDFVKDRIRRVDIHMSSPGGNVRIGLDFNTFLKSLPINLKIHNVGSVESIATAIFLAGDQRCAVPNSRFLFHGIMRIFDPPISSLTEEQLKHLPILNRQNREDWGYIITKETNMTRLQVQEALSKETFFTPVEAKVRGIIHGIKDPVVGDRTIIHNIFDPRKKEQEAGERQNK